MTGLQASFEEERQQILSQFNSKTQQPPQESNDHHSTLQQQGEHTDAHPSFQTQLKDAREALTEQTALREKAEIDVGNLQAQLQAMEQQLKVEADSYQIHDWFQHQAGELKGEVGSLQDHD